SDGEIRKLMKFFGAMSSQAEPFIGERRESLTEQERTMVGELFTSEGGRCREWHRTGVPKRDRRRTGRNFTVGRERLKAGWTWIGVGLAAMLTLLGCGGEKPPETAKSEGAAPAAGGAAAVPDEANGGTVTGKVAFNGEAPKMGTLDMSANPACTRAHKDSPAK